MQVANCNQKQRNIITHGPETQKINIKNCSSYDEHETTETLV